MPIAAADPPALGWANTVAMLVAGAVIFLIWRVDLYIRSRRAEGTTPSPTPSRARRNGANPQVNKVPDTDGTNAGTVGGEWWGRIVTINGVRQRVAGHGAGAAELVDDDLDLPLDEPEDDSEPETLEDWICANFERLGYAETVREGVRRWRVSERTVKRRIADRRRG
jgi:hypothetical protein